MLGVMTSEMFTMYINSGRSKVVIRNEHAQPLATLRFPRLVQSHACAPSYLVLNCFYTQCFMSTLLPKVPACQDLEVGSDRTDLSQSKCDVQQIRQ